MTCEHKYKLPLKSTEYKVKRASIKFFLLKKNYSLQELYHISRKNVSLNVLNTVLLWQIFKYSIGLSADLNLIFLLAKIPNLQIHFYLPA